MNGGGGGGGTTGMSSTAPVVGFSRISPVGRADPSHPRMQLASRPGATPQVPPPSSRSDHAQDPDRGSESAPKEGDSGHDGPGASVGESRRPGSGDEAKVAVSDRVAKLLLAALGKAKASGPSSSAAPPAAVERRKIAAAPKNACFDPPSVRNGLAGLTPNHVDKVLLRVEASTPGAVSCWKSPGGRRRPRTGGTELLTPSTLGHGLATEVNGRRRRQFNLSQDSVGWFDTEGSAREILLAMRRAPGAAGNGGPGARRRKGGGGARRKRSILKIKLPPRTPASRKGGDSSSGTAQAAAPGATRRKSS